MDKEPMDIDSKTPERQEHGHKYPTYEELQEIAAAQQYEHDWKHPTYEEIAAAHDAKKAREKEARNTATETQQPSPFVHPGSGDLTLPSMRDPDDVLKQWYPKIAPNAASAEELPSSVLKDHERQGGSSSSS